MTSRLAWCLVIWSLLGSLILVSQAATFQLNNGQTMSGEPMAPDGAGLIIKLDSTTFSERISWTNFTESTLKELAKDEKFKPYVEIFVEEPEVEEEKRAALEIKPKTGPKLERPDPNAGLGSLFASPVSILLLALVYLANLYAAFEIGIFRNYHPALTCGIAAVIPILGPVIFLCLPTNLGKTAEEEEELIPESTEEELAASDAAAVHEEPAAAHPAAPQGPPKPVVFQRGQFTFNRRFFETKLAGFLRVVPSEEEKDLVLCVESSRGNYIAQRVARITQDELVLKVFKGGVSSEVIVPFAEIKEIQIRSKDA